MDGQTNTAAGHLPLILRLYDGGTLCTVIHADFTAKSVTAENFVSDPVITAFGNNKTPSWQDFLEFLEERCIPRQRAGLREYLDAIGVDEYDPLAIIQKTAGRMAEDNQWLDVK
jgi:hypothetical protein